MWVNLLSRGGALALELERLASPGIWIWTRANRSYPNKYRQRLKGAAPTVLFGAGDQYLPGQPGLAIVGSRNVDEHGQELAETLGNLCALEGLVVYSGGARGVDTYSMKAALEGRGTSVGILAHNLEKVIREPSYRSALTRGDLTLLTPYSPNAGFSVGGAMGRNKLIYTLADYALIIASDANKGSTWAGATEAMKRDWLSVFVLETKDTPEGNQLLIENGGIPFSSKIIDQKIKLRDWFEKNSNSQNQPPPQRKLMWSNNVPASGLLDNCMCIVHISMLQRQAIRIDS